MRLSRLLIGTLRIINALRASEKKQMGWEAGRSFGIQDGSELARLAQMAKFSRRRAIGESWRQMEEREGSCRWTGPSTDVPPPQPTNVELGSAMRGELGVGDRFLRSVRLSRC